MGGVDRASTVRRNAACFAPRGVDGGQGAEAFILGLRVHAQPDRPGYRTGSAVLDGLVRLVWTRIVVAIVGVGMPIRACTRVSRDVAGLPSGHGG
ncbi:hypothetical protein [Nakamurella multipartita]|uniref:Uncharacterized protein n=1 Tax=Nakamurella multipartita (strain ATCC 700099 / DSM 44233 / CIP 104796 / JCM 9543 / NBRC 105858 / Y-104) TaxID=479431 RepID=C8XG23_NAKMY|nr:hypothetical protein [Nakamurella multipartita]ACV80025.1 hypothetical protein Namu_3721 [Nakamurella multipartita DSM 44233]